MTKLALPNVTGDLFVLDPEMLEKGLEGSRQSPRKRIILPIHREQSDLVQRMLNFFQPGTYVTPHHHPNESASETVFVLQGSLGLLIFEESGELRSKHLLTRGSLIDIAPGVWHGMVILEADTVILEAKRGPYDDTDKHFASWAPAEGEEGAAELVKEYEKLFV
ncbi:MAG: WbuC family cupin fold metalloprotein [Verrucomicrobiales bacterium]|nr:WbuC family cupin fold metalloprotein [Verrucomicrobiales bacterium]